MKAALLGGDIATADLPVSGGRGAAWRRSMIVPYLGIVLAVLALDRVDCRQEYLKLNSAGGHWRLNIGKRIALNREQCELVAGGFRTFAGLDTVAVPRSRPGRFISKAQLIR